MVRADAGQITQSLIYVTVQGVLGTIMGLPWGYYHTFVLEEAHGFNKSTKKLWVMGECI